jgi:hypothetical protein
MAKYAVWFIENHSLEKSQPGHRRCFFNIRLQYNTHIEKSCQLVRESASYIFVLSIIPSY